MKTMITLLLCICILFTGSLTTNGQSKFANEETSLNKFSDHENYDYYLQKMNFQDFPSLEYTGNTKHDKKLYDEAIKNQKMSAIKQQVKGSLHEKIAPPDNDNACDALDLGTATGAGTTVAYNLTEATAEPGEPSPGPGTDGSGSCNSQDGWCAFETGVQNSVWFTFTAPASGDVRIEAVSGDTQLALWSVSDCSDLSTAVEIAANDDAGPVFAPIIEITCGSLGLTPGEEYYIQLDGFAGMADIGTLTLTMRTPGGPPPNDNACNASPISLGVLTSFDNTCASPDGPSPGAGSGASSCDSQDGWCSFETDVQNDVWFVFTAPPSGWVSINSGFDAFPYDTQLALWSVSDCSDSGSFLEIAANDDGGVQFASALEGICVDPGATYYVQVDGFSGTSGTGTVEVTDAATPYLCNTGAYKIQVCHDPTGKNPKNICVSINALAAHLAHGDLVGNCEDAIVWPCVSSESRPAIFNDEILINGHIDDVIGIADFGMHPNPAEENVLIQIDDLPEILTEIRIFDQTMRIVYAQELTDFNTNIDVSQMSAGIYIVDIRNAVESCSKKLVVID